MDQAGDLEGDVMNLWSKGDLNPTATSAGKREHWKKYGGWIAAGVVISVVLLLIGFLDRESKDEQLERAVRFGTTAADFQIILDHGPLNEFNAFPGFESNIDDSPQMLTPLNACILFENLACLTFLIEHGVEINPSDSNSMTPLRTAVIARDMRLAEALLDAGADPTAYSNGETPLHLASRLGMTRKVSLLLSYGASVDATSDDGLTPVIVARGLRVVELLVDHGAEPCDPGPMGQTLISRRFMYQRVLEYVVASGCDTGIRDYSSEYIDYPTLLHKVISYEGPYYPAGSPVRMTDIGPWRNAQLKALTVLVQAGVVPDQDVVKFAEERHVAKATLEFLKSHAR